MASRYVSVVAFYGRKPGPLADLLSWLQASLAEALGGSFVAYEPPQIHATLIGLSESAAAMDVERVVELVRAEFTAPRPVRFGGCPAGGPDPFGSRDLPLYERTFSGQGAALVLVGWPVSAWTSRGEVCELDRFRRRLGTARVAHRYHRTATDIDNDLHLVVGHHRAAPVAAVARAVSTVRAELAANVTSVELMPGDVAVVAADSTTLSPPDAVVPLAALTADRLRSLLAQPPQAAAGQV